jgi:hypothetical protein
VNSETGFLRRYFVITRDFAKNPVSLAECVIPATNSCDESSETGFLRRYFVVTKDSAKNPVSLAECVNPHAILTKKPTF